MGNYILKRLILFVPSLLLISVILFFISKISTGDSISNRLELISENVSFDDITTQWSEIEKEKEKLGIDKPAFYFSIYRQSSSDTLYKIADPKIQQSLANLSYAHGSWELVNKYFLELKKLLNSSQINQQEKRVLLALAREGNTTIATKIITQFKSNNYNNLASSFKELVSEKRSKNNFLFHFNWNGLNNQYHNWLSSLVSGKLGNSYIDDESVNEKISTALYWTIILSIVSIFFSFLIGTVAGIYAAQHKGSKIDKLLSYLFYAFYSLPNFWVATLLILFLAGGDFLYLFPSYGLGNIPDSASWFKVLQIRSSHLVLPIVCLSYGSIAFIFRQVRGSMLKQLNSDYVQTAKAKGLNSKIILWKHAFKNASFPLITMIGGVLPAIISGSFVIEFIFSIPGMGKLTIEAFLSRDYPVIFGVLMMSAVIGMLGILIADLLYFINDPRVSFSLNKNRK